MARYADKYGIKIKEKEDAKPKFIFYGPDGEVLEEIALAHLSEEQLHDQLQARGFRFLAD